jgi:phosphatidylglycerophosphate synthase
MVQSGAILGLVAQVLLLEVLDATVGVGRAGWLVALTCALVVSGALAGALNRRGTRLGPADWITLGRAALSGGVAALVADSLLAGTAARPAETATLVVLAGCALVLDGVDGRVARRTGTASELGARFDMEVDAFLILVLSGYAAASFGTWVLGIGLARYAFLAAAWVLPWLRASTPPRYWCKVVAVVQGIVLTAAVSGQLPTALATLALVVAAALLAESFGRQVWWLWLRRDVAVDRPVGAVPVQVPVPAYAERG